MTSITKTDADRSKRDWVLPIAMFLLSLLVSGFISYNHEDKTMSNRVTAIETKQNTQDTNTNDRLNRMENKLDRLLERK